MDLLIVGYDGENYTAAMSDRIEWDAETAAKCLAASINRIADNPDIDPMQFQMAVMQILMGGGGETVEGEAEEIE